jgi:hypothetical protein
VSDSRCPNTTAHRPRVTLALALLGVLALVLTALTWLATAPVASAEPSDQPCGVAADTAMSRAKVLEELLGAEVPA